MCWGVYLAEYSFRINRSQNKDTIFNKLMNNGVAADIAKTMAESVTKYAIALTILIMFALKFFLN